MRCSINVLKNGYKSWLQSHAVIDGKLWGKQKSDWRLILRHKTCSWPRHQRGNADLRYRMQKLVFIEKRWADCILAGCCCLQPIRNTLGDHQPTKSAVVSPILHWFHPHDPCLSNTPLFHVQHLLFCQVKTRETQTLHIYSQWKPTALQQYANPSAPFLFSKRVPVERSV